MKKILFTNIIVLSVILCSSFTLSDLNYDAKDIVGTWNYSVPNAPIDYQQGQLILEEKEGKLSGYTLIGDYKNIIEKPTLKENNLTFYMFIEDTDVAFDLNFKKDTFSGHVTYTEGTLEITGVRKEKE